jgi:cytochrome b6-f complex iron-sulfur subunit
MLFYRVDRDLGGASNVLPVHLCRRQQACRFRSNDCRRHFITVSGGGGFQDFLFRHEFFPPPPRRKQMTEQSKVDTPRPASAPAKSGNGQNKEAINQGRRRLVLACVWGYLGVNFLMFLRYFFPRTLFEPNTQFNIGYSSDFEVGVNQQFLQSHRVWVRKDPGSLFVIHAKCTHLGCTPDWEPTQNIFHCPCHGSEYDIDGINFAGPAPRPMDRCWIAKQADGTILVNKAILFLNEPYAGIDQFNDPNAILPV